jgi:hypothetical protein
MVCSRMLPLVASFLHPLYVTVRLIGSAETALNRGRLHHLP